MKRSDFLKALGVSFLIPAIIKEEVVAEATTVESGFVTSKSITAINRMNSGFDVLVIDDPNPGHGALFTDMHTGEQWVFIQEKGQIGQWFLNNW